MAIAKSAGEVLELVLRRREFRLESTVAILVQFIPIRHLCLFLYRDYVQEPESQIARQFEEESFLNIPAPLSIEVEDPKDDQNYIARKKYAREILALPEDSVKYLKDWLDPIHEYYKWYLEKSQEFCLEIIEMFFVVSHDACNRSACYMARNCDCGYPLTLHSIRAAQQNRIKSCPE